MSATCPVCDAPQAEGLLCNADTTRLERDLGDVASIVADLDVTLSRQAKIGASGKSGKGWAREKLPIHIGAIEAADVLKGTLVAWAVDVGGSPIWQRQPNRARRAASILLSRIPDIRRHHDVVKLVDEIQDAIKQARRVVDRPADRKFFGTCYAVQPDEEGRDVTCIEEIWASPSASEVTCKVCGITHEIGERRAWLLQQAADHLFTVREAAQMMGTVGGITVTEDRIRGYLRRERLLFRPDTNLIRLGDLLTIVINDGERKVA